MDAGCDVKGFKPGDLAAIMVRRPCPHPECRACLAGRPDFCITGDFTERGIRDRHGFMSEYVVDEERYLIPVPGALASVGVLTEPLSVAEKALSQVVQMQDRLPWFAERVEKGRSFEGFNAVVLGAGPIGILGSILLFKSGFRTTVLSRELPSSENAALLKSIGIEYVSTECDDPEKLCKNIPNIDLVFEATGASRFSFKMLPYLGRNGIFIFTGIPGIKEPVEVDTERFMRNLVLKNQVLMGTVNADKAAFTAAVADLAEFKKRWPGALESMLSRIPVADAGRHILGAAKGIKTVISFVS
jgi:threonine dehydrogenase-like Zn-dependent dehydrogenase